MIGFIRNMNLARMIILLAIAGSGYLGWTNWQQYQELKFLRSTFTSQVAKICTEIQEKAKLHTKLNRALRDDEYAGQSNPDSYIRKAADHRNVEIGDVEFTPSNSSRSGGILDKTYTIRPTDRKREFTHDHIARFLYQLETASPQVTVTSIKLQLQGKKPKDDEIPRDAWTFTTVLTNRAKDPNRASRSSGG